MTYKSKTIIHIFLETLLKSWQQQPYTHTLKNSLKLQQLNIVQPDLFSIASCFFQLVSVSTSGHSCCVPFVNGILPPSSRFKLSVLLFTGVDYRVIRAALRH